MIKEAMKFLSYTYRRLLNTVRYSTTPKQIPESVAAHSFFVALTTLVLVEFYRKEYRTEINLEKALIMALVHDIEESYSGDIVAYLKRSSNFRNMLDQECKMFIDAALMYLPTEFKKKLIENWSEFRDGVSPEAHIVKLADIVTALIWSLMEADMGNKYTKQIVSNYILLLKENNAYHMLTKYFEEEAERCGVELDSKFKFGLEE